jgi:hypothetical protein
MYGLPTSPLNVQVQLSGTNVQITWNPPSSTGGTGISLTDYQVFAKAKNPANFVLISSCTGTLSTQTCSVPMLSMSQTPFSLLLGDSIYITVVALNNLGSGEPSTQSDGSLTI